MNHVRRMIAGAFAALITVLLGFAPAQPAQAGEGLLEPSGGDTNEAVAVNTEDGASVFRLAFSIRQVTDGTVDQQNLALAQASCTDCQTVALAFQVVIVVGDANYVAPVNQAAAVNDQCAECLTFASATQIVVGVDGPVVLTDEGRRRLIVLTMRMKALEARLPYLTPAQLEAETSAIEQELIAIFSEELVPAGTQGGASPGGTETSSTTTTSPVQSATSTTVTSTPATSTPVSSPPTTSGGTPVTTTGEGVPETTPTTAASG